MLLGITTWPFEESFTVFILVLTYMVRLSLKEVNELTKAYVGPLFKDIFKTLSHLEHLYTSFPEGKITRQSIEIGGQTEKQFEERCAWGAIPRASPLQKTWIISTETLNKNQLLIPLESYLAKQK